MSMQQLFQDVYIWLELSLAIGLATELTALRADLQDVHRPDIPNSFQTLF